MAKTKPKKNMTQEEIDNLEADKKKTKAASATADKKKTPAPKPKQSGSNHSLKTLQDVT